MIHKLIVAPFFAAITLSLTVPVVWAGNALSGKEVIFKTYFNANGQLVEKGDSVTGASSAPVFPAHGTWKVKKGKLCFTFSDSLRKKSKQMCHKVLKKGDGTYELTNKGKVKRVWKKILPGNPYNLK